MKLKRRLRGLRQIYLLRARRRWSYLLAVVTTVAGVALAIVEPVPGLLGLGGALLVLGVVGPLADGLAFWRERRRLVLHDVDPLSRLDRPNLQNAAGYVRRKFGAQRWIHSPAVDSALRAEDAPIAVAPGAYRLPDQAWEVRSFILTDRMWGQTMFDSDLVRMASDLAAPLGPDPVMVQRTTYFDGECSNEVMDQVVDRRGSVGRSAVAYEPMDLALDGRLLLDLRSSLCANIIGISTLALTADGRVVIPSQSDQNARSKRQLAPSGSGSAEMRDVWPGDTLQDFVCRAMTRELVEECFDDPANPPAVSTKVIGFTRVVTRGGKPEFFGVSRVDAPFSAVKRERLFVQDITEASVRLESGASARADLRNLRTRYRARFSLAMDINLGLLEAWLEEAPSDALALLGTGAGGR